MKKYQKLFFIGVNALTALAMVILSVIVFTAVRFTVISHDAEHLTSALIDLFDDFLSLTVVNLGVTDHHNRAVALFGDNGGVDYLTERRSVDNNIVVNLTAFRNESREVFTVQEFNGVRRILSREKNL
jgi:hypothetical protein